MIRTGSACRAAGITSSTSTFPQVSRPRRSCSNSKTTPGHGNIGHIGARTRSPWGPTGLPLVSLWGIRCLNRGGGSCSSSRATTSGRRRPLRSRGSLTLCTAAKRRGTSRRRGTSIRGACGWAGSRKDGPSNCTTRKTSLSHRASYPPARRRSIWTSTARRVGSMCFRSTATLSSKTRPKRPSIAALSYRSGVATTTRIPRRRSIRMRESRRRPTIDSPGRWNTRPVASHSPLCNRRCTSVIHRKVCPTGRRSGTRPFGVRPLMRTMARTAS